MELATIRTDLDFTMATLIDGITEFILMRIMHDLAFNDTIKLNDLYDRCQIKRGSYHDNVLNSGYNNQIIAQVEKQLRKKGILCNIKFDLKKNDQITKIVYRARLIRKVTTLQILHLLLISILLILLLYVNYPTIKKRIEFSALLKRLI